MSSSDYIHCYQYIFCEIIYTSLYWQSLKDHVLPYGLWNFKGKDVRAIYFKWSLRLYVTITARVHLVKAHVRLIFWFGVIFIRETEKLKTNIHERVIKKCASNIYSTASTQPLRMWTQIIFFLITIYTIVNIYYNNLYAALDRFTETCNHNYTKIWTNTSYFIHIFLQYFKQIPYERIRLTGTHVIN